MKSPVVRDLRWVSDRQRSEALERAREGWDSWLVECLPQGQGDRWQPAFELNVAADSAVPLPAGPWQAHGTSGVGRPTGWSQWSERGRQHLASRLLGRATSAAALPENDWALLAADEAWQRLTASLLGSKLATADADCDAPDNQPWSGVLFITEPSLGACWAWQPAPAVAPNGAPLQQPLLACLRQRTVKLQAELGDVYINLADLLALQVGDVVRFPATAKAGVPVKLNAHPRIAGFAEIGQADGRLALRMSPSSSVRS